MSALSFVLASRSPRRKEILETAGFVFSVRPCELTESQLVGDECGASPRNLALAKARCVARTASAGLVVGADTMVVIGDDVLGKPDGPADALRMLELLSGRTHVVVTGVALVQSGRALADEERTTVRFRDLTRSELAWYVGTGEPLDKAGAYAVQGHGSVLVERIEGSYLNVVGFPLNLFVRMIETFTGRSWLHFVGSRRFAGDAVSGERACPEGAGTPILSAGDRRED
jgi:septum formation protein